MSIRSFIIAVALFSSTLVSVAQTTQFNQGYSWRYYLGDVAPTCPDRLCHYRPTNSFDNMYEEFAAWRGPNANNATSFMNFRVAFPLNYDPNRPEPYPVILMLHGAGESGRIWSGNFNYDPTNPLYDNNSRNLLHGGNVHQQAANRNPSHPQAFPGIIIFPQVSYSGSWASGWQEDPTTNQEYIYEFLEYMVADYNANINRIYIHGLSNGGRGTWDTATKRPDLFAAALPMSGLPYNSDISAERLETTPIRLYQGGTDTNPSPGGAVSMINKLVANGGNPQYILYPTLGHGVWNQAYGEADFWSWMLDKDKRKIYSYGDRRHLNNGEVLDLCPGASRRLGFSYGYTSYQWKKGGQPIAGATNRDLTINGTGDYTGEYSVAFTRPNGSTGESFAVTIVGEGTPIVPELTATGSLVLQYTRDNNTGPIGSIGQAESRLHAPSGYTEYQWYRGGVLQATTTVNNAKISHGAGTSNDGVINNQNAATNAGNWTVRVLQNSGCYSNHSNVKTLVYNTNPHTLPTGGSVSQTSGSYMANISIPQLQAQSATQMLVTWTETVPDEEFFEIWRQNQTTNNNWNMVGIVPANSTQFLDKGLNPNTGYAYTVRAMVSNSGRFSRKSANNDNNFTKTLLDNQAPTPPSQLTLVSATQNSITISWVPSSDNHAVNAYELFNGTTLVATLTGAPHPPTSYTFTNLEEGGTYLLNVRAVDFSGNKSNFPQALSASTQTLVNGVAYNYFFRNPMPGSNGNRLEGFDFDQTPTQTGTASHFGNPTVDAIGIQWQGGSDPSNFFLDYHGFINITTAGNYRFYTSSDDGSRLYIDDELIVNSDFDQGTTIRSGVVSNLSTGLHKIRVQYYEVGGGNVLTVGFNYSTQTSILTWNNSTTYSANDIVVRNGTYYRSLRNNNLNQQPPNNSYWGSLGSTQPTLPITSTSITSIPTWASNIAYAVGDIVVRNGTYYRAIQGGTSNQPPNATFWTSLGNTAPTFHPTNNGPAVIIPTEYLFTIGTPMLTNYYYVPSTNDLTNTNNWWSNSIGTGNHPANFTINNTVFNIPSNQTLSSAWTVSGTNSYVKITNGATLTLAGTLTGRLSADAGTTIDLNTSSPPAFYQLNPASTVNMNVAGTVPQAVYGNLNLGTGNKTLPISSTSVAGNLQVSDQVTLNGSTAPDRSTLTVAGNITFQGNSGAPPAVNQRYSLVLEGTTSHTISVNGTNIALAGLDAEGAVNLNFNDSNPHTITVGIPNGSGGLLLRSGSTLNLGQHNLVVNGVYGVNPTGDTGELSTDGGDITITTSSGQTSNLNFSLDSYAVRNLSISNTGQGQVNLANSTTLHNLMTVGVGTVVNMQGDFVLRSVSDAANGTARIGPLLNGARVNGNITAERYMSGEGRIYRYISSPVENVRVEDLQEFFPITGNFDGTSTGEGLTANTSMWEYSEPAYVPFPTAGGTNQQTLERGKGYSAFIREGSASTTWEVTGVPHQGTIPFEVTPGTGDENEGWNLLGNPYPSPIQWTGGSTGGWTMSGVNNTVYIRENTSVTTGGFQSHNGSTGTDGFDGIIAPGQAFWVRTTTPGASIQISEAAKSTTDGAFFRETMPENTLEIVLRSAQMQDATFIQFRDAATAAFDTELDGVKQLNTGLNLSSLTSDGKSMVINLTTPHYCEQEVSLRIAGATPGNYQLDINNVESIISNEKVTLIDNFLQTETEITGAVSRTVSITADPASKADGRFVLRFEKPEVRLDMNLASTPGCDSNSPSINIDNAQPGVTYQAFYNGIPVSEALMATTGTFDLPLGVDQLAYGVNTISLTAGFKTCNNFDLAQTVNVQRDSLAVPVITIENSRLTTTKGTKATYRWFFEDTELVGQTSATLLPDGEGNYFVEVTQGSCTKVSDPFVYLITSIESPERGMFHPYPNPTTGIIHLELNPGTPKYMINLSDAMGKMVVAEITPIGDNIIEINLTELPSGLYILSANGYRYRIIKRR